MDSTSILNDVEKKEIYFIISYQRKQKENSDDFNFLLSDKENNKPIIIYINELEEENKTYFYKKVFKFFIKQKKKSENSQKSINIYNQIFTFKINEDKYILSFDTKGNSFIYDVDLKMENKNLNEIISIDQNIIEINEKMNIFKEALKKNKEEHKIEQLIKETIEKKVNSVKDFLLFKVIYDEETGNSKEKLLLAALKKLDNIKESFNNNVNVSKIFKDNKKIFYKITEILSNNEYKIHKFMQQMIKYFNIDEKNKFQLIDDLNIIFKSKKYEDVKKIFFDNFPIKRIKFPKNIELSNMKLEEFKKTINNLRKNKIYDYKSNSGFYKFFPSIYEKKNQ